LKQFLLYVPIFLAALLFFEGTKRAFPKALGSAFLHPEKNSNPPQKNTTSIRAKTNNRNGIL
jgi:hypothetical protein